MPPKEDQEDPDSEELQSLRKSRRLVRKNLLALQGTSTRWDLERVSVQEIRFVLDELGEVATEIKKLEKQTYAACDNDTDWGRHEPSLDALKQAVSKSLIAVQTTLDARTVATRTPGGQPAPQVTVTPFREKVDLPTFDGTFSKWRAFHDLFIHKTTVEKITSGASKLALLLTKLTGDAASIISSYPPTDANYQSAWDDICARYDNKREIAFSHLREFHELKAQPEESAGNVRKVLDTLKETVRSIQNLGAPPTPDLLYIFLATKKLDTKTKEWWAIHNQSEFPTLDEFTKFLEARAIALMQNPSTASTSSHGKKSHTSHHSAQQSTQSGRRCPIHVNESHGLWACSEFRAKSVRERADLAYKHRLCYNCLDSQQHMAQDCTYKLSCQVCFKRHHTLLHPEANPRHRAAATTAPTPPALTPAPPNPPSLGPGTTTSASHCTPTRHPEDSVVLLGTILANVKDVKGQEATVRVFVDSGSESHFISEGCMARLGLKRQRTCVTLKGIGGIKGPDIKGEASFALASRISKYTLQIQALILPQISGLIPKATCRADWSHLHGLQLSDPQYSKAAPVDILLGAKKANHILVGETKRDPKNVDAPVAIKTQFGWMVTGEAPQVHPSSRFTVTTHHVSCTTAHQELKDALSQFWELEEPTPLPQPMSCNDVAAEKHFLQHLQHNQDGSYTVRLPFKSPAPQLGNSREAALSRFHKLETKLQRHPEVATEYKKSMAKYKELGFLEQVPESDNKKDSESYYIPHHVVIKPSSTSTSHRVVYDASMKTSTGVSLNDALLTGPKLQVDLQPLLTRFRSHQIAMSADIEKFYPQTHVHLEDRDFQRFFWREVPQEPLQTLRMTRVTFGLTCAPFLAIRALHHLAQSQALQFSEAAKVIRDDFLVDNLLSGGRNPEEALLLQTQLTQVMGSGNMKLLKWASNCPEVTNSVPPEARDRSQSLKIGEGEEDPIKTIGVNWHPQTDRFSLCIADTDTPTVTTKRSVLSLIARTFDPLGWISPVTVRAKTLMQKLWAHPLDWDEPIPLEYHRIWRNYRDDLALLHQFSLDRNICKHPHVSSKNCFHQLHGFCDGSDVAYAACAYVRTQDHQGRVGVQLVSSKTKVNPVNGQTTPRSELCGAVLLSHLMDSIVRALPDVQFQSTHLWTDSTVVLGRVNPEIKLPIFELNRVSKILSLFPQQHWNHVKGEENPADCASRGISARELLTHPLWLHGPAWLTESDQPESVVTVHATQQSTPPQPVSDFIKNCSSLFRMKRVVAHWVRYKSNLVLAIMKEKRTGPILVRELDAALTVIVKIVQQDSFKVEITQLQENPNRLPSRFKHLAPFLDEEGVIRVGGRLKNAVAPDEKKHQALLPNSHHFVEVLARHIHVTNLHAGPNQLLSLLRDRYWIVRGPDLTKRIVRRCTVCLRHTAVPSTQLMAHLPPSRVNPAPPFSKVGVDYAGPYQLMLRTGRKPPMTKAYVSLFVCMASKAIHLELVHDLSTEAFLAALTRFISRRGKPEAVFCDGGTNFVGAKRELLEIQAFLQDPTHQQKMTQAATKDGITFQINPPASPHHGGLWEAGVKSMKYHLRRVMGDRHLTVSEFGTLLTQVEAILNSRPLTPLSSDPNDLSALTPGHFLIGRPLVAIPQLDTTTTKEGRLDRWQRVQQLGQHFWTRWSQEYLTLLNSRPKWLTPTPNYEVGMLVLLRAEDNAFAPQKWKLGRIVSVHPGSDGMVRVCDVRTNVTSNNPAGTILRRPVVKISPLPFYD